MTIEDVVVLISFVLLVLLCMAIAAIGAKEE
jgi:hypothetical protein